MTTLPELDAEQEVDFRRYGRLLALRWWLVAAGLLIGIVLGWAAAAGGGSVWTATALISLGQPTSPGGVAVNYYTSNPRNINEIARSESAVKQAARVAGEPVSALRGNISTGTVGTGSTSGAGRAVPLLSLSVQGARPTKVAAAANELAQIVVQRTTAPYVGVKIARLESQLTSLQQRIDVQTQTVTQLQQQAANKSLSPIDRLSLVTQLNGAVQYLGNLKDEQNAAQQQLAFAKAVESATIVSQAAPEKTTARSRRTSMLVGALIGLILGGLAAILWEPLAARFARRT
jgi:uncharacterized protein involved in exopolysaccharide biosynthesis